MNIDNKKKISLEFLYSIGILNQTELTKCIEAIHNCESKMYKRIEDNNIEEEHNEYCQKKSTAYDKDNIIIVYYGVVNDNICISISNKNNYTIYLNSNTELYTLSDSDTIYGSIQIKYPTNKRKEQYITIKPKESLLLFLSYTCDSFKISLFKELRIQLSAYRYNKNLNKISMKTHEEIDKICNDPRFISYNIKLKLSTDLTCEAEILQFVTQNMQFK